MIICNHCDKHIDKINYCSTKCRVSAFRKKSSGGTGIPASATKIYSLKWLRDNVLNWNDLCPNHGVKIFDCAFIKHPKKENTGSLEKIYNTS